MFSSDAISSTAYGTEQIMLILITAGAVATGLALPVALGIGGLLAVLIPVLPADHHRLPVGWWRLHRDQGQLRPWAGPGRRISAADRLRADRGRERHQRGGRPDDRVRAAAAVHLPLSLPAIALIAWANLAGVREWAAFAVPTYLFIGSCALMLLVGLVRQLTGYLAPIPAGETAPLPPQTATVGLLLVLHAFAAGYRADRGGGHLQRRARSAAQRPRTPAGP